MALKPVTDPNILAALGSPTLPAQPAAPAAPAGPTPVTDPALLAQLNAPEAPAAPAAPITAPEPSIWESFLQTAGNKLTDTAKGLGTIAMGAPEVAMDAIGNFGTNAVAGLTAPLVGTTPEDQANFIQDFTAQHTMQPQGESARQLSGALGDLFSPVGKVKRALGDTTLAATGSPLAATTADMLPDLAAAVFGGKPTAEAGAGVDTARMTRLDVQPGVEGGRFGLTKAPAANPHPNAIISADAADLGERLAGGRANLGPAPKPVSPIVGDLRAADIRMRPSDVRAMNPDKAVKVPGEFREKFASGPQLKEDLTLHNQAKMTGIAAKDIGVKALDDASLAKAKEGPAATYQMVEDAIAAKPEVVMPEFQKVYREAVDSAKLPKGEGHDVTRVIGALRRRAAKRMQNDQVATEEAGFADRDMADRLEEQMGKALEAAGEPQLLKEYQDARQQFAKIHDVETATRAGQIDANTVYKLGKRGVPLSGGLKLIADAAENAPNVTGHSLKTAARAGEEVPNSRSGIITRGAKKLVRSLGVPGTDLTMDVGSPKFQKSLGPADPARASYYGTEPNIPAPREPQQGGLDLRDMMALEPPPGAVGAPQRAPREFGPQVDALGNAFEFEMAPGETGVPPPAPISLQDLLGLGEPLNLKQSPGRVGKPKRKP